EHDPLAPLPEHAAEDRLGLAIPVAVGRVEEVDPRVEGARDELARRALVEPADRLPHALGAAEGHAAHAELRDAEPRSPERSIAHALPPPSRLSPRGGPW